MKKIIKDYKKRILLLIIFALMFLSSNAFAIDVNWETTEAYKKWEELPPDEKEIISMPQSFSIDVPKSILEQYEIDNTPRLINSLLNDNKYNFKTVSATSSDKKYNLADKLNIRVENQGITNECWAFSTIKAMETNIALKSGLSELKDFSERHMDYSSVRNFTDGTNDKALNRKTGDGGLPIMALAYLTNGQGAVLEDDMPFENNTNPISIKDLNKNVDTIVTDYVVLPTINKDYRKDIKGNTTSVTYYDNNGNVYTDSELKALRKIIKEHIIKNGAITAMNAGSKAEYYNNGSIFSSTAYNCNDTNVTRDHAVTIVGWDDNYSKNNFKEGKRPSTDGAYIVLNTYGTQSFDKGYIYISYEDFFIETDLYGVVSTSSVDYDNLYQYNEQGGILNLDTKTKKVGYFANTFSRDSRKEETLNNVGITVCDYVNVEIYVNPNNTSLNKDDLVLVGKVNSVLEPGYHRIGISPIKLTGSDFAIVIKQTSIDENMFKFSVEANVKDSPYSMITSENRSYVSEDGVKWENLASLNVDGIDVTRTDVCIKGFTIEEDNSSKNISSPVYNIDNKYIMNINHNTTKTELLKNIKTNFEIKIYDESYNEIFKDNEILRTGMKLKLSNNEEYTLIVRGDNNSDGRISILDVSRLSSYYTGLKKNILNSEELKAADMNLDGKISILDVAQMFVLYNSL